MITDKEFAQALRDMGQGELVCVGEILSGLSNEQIAWMILEAVDCPVGIRYTLHAYWHDIFVLSKVVVLTPDDKLLWGNTGND